MNNIAQLHTRGPQVMLGMACDVGHGKGGQVGVTGQMSWHAPGVRRGVKVLGLLPSLLILISTYSNTDTNGDYEYLFN